MPLNKECHVLLKMMKDNIELWGKKKCIDIIVSQLLNNIIYIVNINIAHEGLKAERKNDEQSKDSYEPITNEEKNSFGEISSPKESFGEISSPKSVSSDGSA